MRIAFVHPRYPAAEGTGAVHDATQIVTGLADAGHEVAVYCPQAPADPVAHSGLTVHHLSGQSCHPHSDTRLDREVLARQDELANYDVVHAYPTSLLAAMGSLGSEEDVGAVLTLNSYRGVCAKNDLRHLDREACRQKSTTKCLNCLTRSSVGNGPSGSLYRAGSRLFSLRLVNRGEAQSDGVDAFQAVSPRVRDTYADFGFDRERISVVPNILDGRFEVDHASDFEEPFRLLYVGALRHRKGVDRLPAVLSRVRANANDAVELTIVGDGDLQDSLSSAVRDRGLTDGVDIVGRVAYEQLPAVYASHDLFVYPGRFEEPFGRVFLEALAAGTPVVSTAVGSVGEIVGEAGVLTEQHTAALADGIVSVLDRSTLEAMSAAAADRLDQYRRERVVRQFESLYETVR